MLEEKVKKSDFRVLLAYPNFTKMLTPSYAVGLFTAILKQQGYQVKLFDCTPYLTSYNPRDMPNPAVLTRKLLSNKPVDPSFYKEGVKTDLFGDFVREIEDFRPYAVVFSTVVEDTWPQARDMLKALSEYPGIKSIIGGVYSTMVPHRVITDPHTQIVGFGEGEKTVVEFCEAVRNGASLTNLLGTFARGENGKIVYNAPRPLVDVNQTPIADFSLFDKKRFKRPLGRVNPASKDGMWMAIPIETYRGCPYTCTFCNSPTQKILAQEREQGDFLRRKTMDTLRKEITTLLEQNDGDLLYINDDAFMARPMSEIDDFIEMYRDIRVPFWMQTRFEDIRDEGQLARLKEVGLHHMSLGLEHGNEEYRRKILRRNISNEGMIEKSLIVQRVGIPYQVNVIIGMPYETRELVFETIALNREFGGFEAVAPNIFTPYHGTVLREMALREGWLDPEAQTSSFVGASLLRMPRPYLQENEMSALQRTYRFYVEFPKDRWPEIERVEMLLTAGAPEAETEWEKLKDEFYQKKWGITESERKLTYAG